MILRGHTEADEPRVEIENLGLFQQQRWLFRNMTLSIRAGSFVAIVGPSGVGKTSLLACLAGMRQPTEGSVHYQRREEMWHPSQYRRKLGIVFQHLRLAENSPVLTNVLCGRLQQFHFLQTLFGFPSRLRGEASGYLHDLGLLEYAHIPVNQISGGEQQRVAIARALFQDPTVYLADEPVSHLDTYLTGRVLGLLKLQAMDRGRIIFCVLHDASLVNRFADYSLSLNREEPTEWRIRAVHPSLAKSLPSA